MDPGVSEKLRPIEHSSCSQSQLSAQHGMYIRTSPPCRPARRHSQPPPTAATHYFGAQRGHLVAIAGHRHCRTPVGSALCLCFATQQQLFPFFFRYARRCHRDCCDQRHVTSQFSLVSHYLSPHTEKRSHPGAVTCAKHITHACHLAADP